MRGVAGALVVLATAAVGVPAASAGTYDVVSCGAPGAGGINRAWGGEASGFQSGSTNIPPDPSSYVIADQCGTQLLIQTAPPPANAPFLTGGNWTFDAPAGTRITRLETWRFGGKLRTGANDPDGDTWKIFARDENASVIGGVFGETCTAPPGSVGCTFGSETGVSDASHAVYPVNVTKISYSISCEYLSGCPRYYDDGTTRASIATIKIFGTRVTVSDPTAPSLNVGGSLQRPGWHKASDTVTYDASDNSGIRAVRLDLGGRTRRDAVTCDYHLTAPCVAQRSASLRVPVGTPDGTYSARIVAEDASGNETPIARTIRVDGTPPSAGIVSTKGRRIVLKVSDPASGLARARLEVRRHGNEAYRTLTATIKTGKLRAKVDKGKAAKLDMRLTLRDNAGNVARGNPTRLTATRARVGHRFHNVRAGGLKLPFGRAARLRGRLTLSAGQSFAGQMIVATARVRKKGAKTRLAGTATTNRHGRFAINIPAGPSRAYRLAFKGSGGALANARDISVRVPASSTIRASRTHISGGRVRFSGHLRSGGLRVPRGLVVVLQGREGGKWQTFEDARTKNGGRWHVAYRFSGRPGNYPIRLRIRRQARFPFELGYSRRLTIRVS
jgi:hypothetical protein